MSDLPVPVIIPTFNRASCLPEALEMVYLHAYDTPKEVDRALSSYFAFYNAARAHQVRDQRTSDAVYFAATDLERAG